MIYELLLRWFSPRVSMVLTAVWLALLVLLVVLFWDIGPTEFRYLDG